MPRTAGFLAYVRPTFMFPAVGMSVYGGALSAGVADPVAGGLHAGLVGVALLVAHLRDGYVDGHRRGEETPRLSVGAFRRGSRLGSLVALGLTAALFARAGLPAAASGGALLGLAWLHAPHLDRHPLTVTVDYPAGIGVALLGGYAAQAGGVTLRVAGVAAAFVGLLSGIKVGIDRLDAAFDGEIDKRTIPVVYGPRGAGRIAVGAFAATAALTAVVAVRGASPAAAVAAAAVPVGCAVTTGLAPPGRAVRIQMGLTYVFAALLFVGVCDGCLGAEYAARAAGFVPG